MTKKKLSNAERLGFALQQSNPVTTEQIVEEMVNSRRIKICEEKCVSNRVVCVLRPMCPKRRFLDVMIVSGITLTTNPSLPVFCYKQRLKELRQDYLDSRPFSLPDARVFYDGLLEIAGKKRKKKGKNESVQILESLGEAIDTYFEIQPDIYVSILGKDLFLIDGETGICVINPENRKISPAFFQGLANLFAKHYKLNLEIVEESKNFFMLEFKFKDLNPSLVQLNLKNLKTDYVTGFDEHSIICEVDFNQGTISSFIEDFDDRMTIKDFQSLFEDVKELASSSKKE